MMDNSRILLSGEIAGELRLSHELYGEHFFQGEIAVARMSGAIDKLPFVVPGKHAQQAQAGNSVGIIGQLRSYRRPVPGGARLQLMVFARQIGPPTGVGVNEAEVTGTLLRDPSVRQTPLGREIADLLLTVERPYGKTDCIPCIAWGKHAHQCAQLMAGQRLRLLGRLQSRVYQKDLGDGVVQERVTYEVSVGSVYEEAEV